MTKTPSVPFTQEGVDRLAKADGLLADALAELQRRVEGLELRERGAL